MPTSIEWTNEVWNPVTGCSKVSAGCENCYAIKMAHRLAHIKHSAEKYAGLTEVTKGGKVNWTGKVRMIHDELRRPMGWKKPRRVFVDSMGDLFHKDVSFDFIDLVFASMAINSQHTFQILTKRPERAVEYFRYKSNAWVNPGMRGDERIRYQTHHYFGQEINSLHWRWPLPNVWIGTSVENQKTANERIPHLIRIPAAVRFLSCEPLLGPIDLLEIGNDPCIRATAPDNIQWVIAGGESGHGARPVHPDWVRGLRDECKRAGVPFFFKQWGEWMSFEEAAQPPFYYPSSNPAKVYDGHGMNFTDPETSEPGRWQGGQWMDVIEAMLMWEETGSNQRVMPLRIGKKRSGNKLDNRRHEEFPDTGTAISNNR